MSGSDIRGRFAQAQFGRWFGIYFAFAAALFFAGAFLGYVVADPAILDQLADVDGEPLFPEEITTWVIFLNNVLAIGVTALGIVTLGLAAVFSVVVNGFILGLVFGLALTVIPVTTALILVIPHGVIELTAFFLVAGITFRVNHRLARYVAGHDETVLTRQELFEMGVLFVVAVVLIAIAAWIEANVTLALTEVVL